MSKSLALAAAMMAGITVAAAAQTVRTPVSPAVQQMDVANIQAAMVAAQAAALKPGDEALGCEALQREIVSTMNDPSLQAYAAKTNPTVARDLAVKDKTKGALSPEIAAAMAAALAPSMGMASMAQLAMPVPGQQVTPAQMQQAMMAQMTQLATIMPALMRSQRVVGLAAVKNCPWATGAGLYPGLAPTR